MNKILSSYSNSFKGLSEEVWMLSFVILINRIATMVIPFLGVYMIQDMNFSIKETGIVLSFFGMGSVAGSYIGGWLTDKVGFYKVQLYSLLLSAPLYVWLPSLDTVFGLSVGVFILSLVAESFRPANSVALAFYTKKVNITKAFSLNRMAVNLGFSIGPALGGFLAGISYDWLFYGNALGTFLAGILLLYYFKNKAVLIPQKSKIYVKKGKSPYSDLKMLGFMVLCALYAVCFFQLLGTLPLFYKQVHQLTEIQIGTVLGYSGLFIVVFEMLIVELAGKHFSLSQIIVAGTVLCGLSFVMLNFSLGYWMLFVSITVLCISEILAMPYMSTVFINSSTEANRGVYMGMYSLAFSVSHIISPFMGTFIIDHYSFSSLWFVTGVISVFTAIGFYILMKKKAFSVT